MTLTFCRRKLIAYGVMSVGAIFYVGWISSISYFNVSQHWKNDKTLAVVQTQVVPALREKVKQASIACNDNASVATDAIVTASNPQNLPTIDSLSDCPKQK